MESEKVKEIKKALWCFTTEELLHPCKECPYTDNCNCIVTLHTNITTLINELESDNERIKNIGLNEDITVKEWLQENKELKDRIAKLEKDNELLHTAKVVYETVDYCYEDLQKAEKRIAELEIKNEVLCVELSRYTENCIEMKNCTLKQFAERLKAKMTIHYPSVIESIDETLKEFLK